MNRVHLALALLALAGAAPAAVAETVALAGTELTVERPESWVRISAQQNLESMERAGYGDARFQALARQAMAGTSFLSFARRTGVHALMTPVVRVAARPAPGGRATAPTELIRGSIAAVTRAVADARIEEGPIESARFGQGGASVRLAYTIGAGPDAVPVRSQLWVIVRGDRVFLFSITMAEDEIASVWPEADAILNSIRIAPPGG